MKYTKLYYDEGIYIQLANSGHHLWISTFVDWCGMEGKKTLLGHSSGLQKNLKITINPPPNEGSVCLSGQQPNKAAVLDVPWWCCRGALLAAALTKPLQQRMPAAAPARQRWTQQWWTPEPQNTTAGASGLGWSQSSCRGTLQKAVVGGRSSLPHKYRGVHPCFILNAWLNGLPAHRKTPSFHNTF